MNEEFQGEIYHLNNVPESSENRYPRYSSITKDIKAALGSMKAGKAPKEDSTGVDIIQDAGETADDKHLKRGKIQS